MRALGGALAALVVTAATTAIVACNHSGRNDYAGAAVTAGAAVGGAALYRATTGGCWAQCLHGLVCDPKSGLCVEHPPCAGHCAPNEDCIQEAATVHCVEKRDASPPASALLDASAPHDASADAPAR